MGGAGNNVTAFTPLDRELAVGSLWVAMSDTEKRPKRGFLRLLILGLIVLAAVLLHNLTKSDRYTLIKTQGIATVYKLDKFTGQVWRSGNADRWYEIRHFE